MICNDQQLKSLLHGDENSAEYETALQHVEHCSTCRLRLEQLAASKELWRDSQLALTGDAWDERLVGSTIDSAWQRLQRTKASAAWSESMARQLLDPPSHPEMLGRLGRYEVERLIGSGGMGVVFKAFDTELNRPVAIKVLAPHLAVVARRDNVLPAKPAPRQRWCMNISCRSTMWNRMALLRIW